MTTPKKLLALFAILFAIPSLAADNTVTLDDGRKFTIRWGADWVVGDPIAESPHGTITIHGANPNVWRLTVVPLPPHPTLTGDIGNLRIYVRNMARGLENGGATVGAEHLPLNGSNARGFYFTIKYQINKPKRQVRLQGGDYAQGYTGAISVNGKPYLFEVLWSNGGETAGNAALAALKTLNIR